MRIRQLCVGVAATAAMAGAAGAQAATGQQVFVGELEEQADATVRMKTGGDNEHRVKVFSVRNFTVDCDGEDGIIKRATIKGRIPVGTKGRFHARDDNGDTALNVRGEIDGRNAEGVSRFSGDIEDEDGGVQECDSGRLEWSAHASAS
jgi:hypothetical protein